MSDNYDEEDEYAFANVAASALKKNGDEDPITDPAEVERRKKLEERELRIKNLEEEIAEQKRIIAQSSEKFETIDRIKKVFSPQDDEEIQERERAKKIKEFDIDPLTGVKRIVNEDLDEIRNELKSIKATKVAEAAMAEINRDYEVDWESNKSKIMRELQTLDSEYRRQNPKAALLRAARLAGVAKKKSGMPDILTPGYTPAERAKYEKSLSDRYIDSIDRGKESASAKALDALYS